MAKRICVLEDNEEILNIITFVFQEQDFEVFGFETVKEFNQNYMALEPSICLLDVMLPDGNGIDVCRSIKCDKATEHIPVVMMTANSRIDEMKNICPAEDFIAKPFDLNDLTNRIIRLIPETM